MSTTEQKALAEIGRIRSHYGKEIICCNMPVPGDPGDGYLQPPDPPSCCQCPDEDVDDLLNTIEGELRRLSAENEAQLAQIQHLVLERDGADETIAALRAQVEALTKNWRELGLERCEFDDACDFCERPEGGIFTHLIHHAEDVTEADFYICVKCLHAAIKRNPATSPLTRPAVPERSSEHYDEVRATLTGLRTLCQNISNIELRVGPLGSHARGYTHKITAALRHLERLAAPQPEVQALPLMSKSFRTTVVHGPSQRYEMVFAFRSIEDLHAADDEWRAFRRSTPQPEVQAAEVWDSNLLGEIIGCFDAAFAEGLNEALAESDDSRLVDLVNRRLMHAYYAAIGPSKPEAQPTEAAQPVQYLQESDQQLLRRFIETAEDDESFDIGMPAVKRLADLGVVRNCGFGRYAVTMFGCWVHEHFWHQNPPLPLMTNADRDAAQKAKLAAQKGGA